MLVASRVKKLKNVSKFGGFGIEFDDMSPSVTQWEFLVDAGHISPSIYASSAISSFGEYYVVQFTPWQIVSPKIIV